MYEGISVAFIMENIKKSFFLFLIGPKFSNEENDILADLENALFDNCLAIDKSSMTCKYL